MDFFNTRKPRGFHHTFIYTDEQKEKLSQLENDVKRGMGILPSDELNAMNFRGNFKNTFFLRHHTSNKSLFIAFAIFIIVLLVFLWNYLITNQW